MFKNITDEDWATITENENNPLFHAIEKIQNEIYNYYVTKLLNDLKLATKANKNVDASIYGGVLSGIEDASLRAICQEGHKRQENRTNKKSP